jgi:hypothetical protein
MSSVRDLRHVTLIIGNYSFTYAVTKLAHTLHVWGTRGDRTGSPPTNPNQEFTMKLVRSIFLALALLLPTAWTMAKAADAPAGDAAGDAKKEKKSKKSKKAEGGEEKKADDKAAK